MQTKTLEIHSENILPIIKKWLYSDKDIFVRELVSNACDAINKLRFLREQGEAAVSDEEFRIEIKVNEEEQTLTFTDTGLGMTAAEVEKYIAHVAFSGAEDFMKKYETNNEKDQIIGHFGLGFYSAFMIADNVTINSLSYQEGAEAALWKCDGSTEYQLGAGEKASRGTEITLHVNDEDKEYLELSKLTEILTKYSRFLPVPVFLNETRINPQEPLWVKSPSECSEEEYLEFYKYLYPFEEPPLFWVHLNVDYPFHLQGILYFPKLRKDFDFSKSAVSLYCSRVFVSDDCKDVMPEYLTMLRGVIDSPDIPLNVSRSYLQMDRTVRQLGTHISKKVSDRLTALYKTEKERFLKCWEDVEVIVKLGVMQDEKFYSRVKECLVWKTLEGEWTTIEDYTERNKEKHADKIFYTMSDQKASQFQQMYRNKGIEVLVTNPYIDSHLMQFLEGKCAPAKFQRIDGAVEDVILDTTKENTILDAEGKTAAGKLADFIRSNIDEEAFDVEAKSLANDNLPAFLVIDEQTRRLQEFIRSSGSKDFSIGGSPLGKSTLVVNSNNALIQSIQALHVKDAPLAKQLLKQVVTLAQLSQRELDVDAVDNFVSETYGVLAELSKKLT